MIHLQIVNMVYLKLSALFQKRGEALNQAAADPNFYLEKVGGKFYRNTPVDTLLKYRDSWPLLV